MITHLLGSSGFNPSTSAVNYQFISSVQRTSYNATQTNRDAVVPIACVLSEFYMYVGTAPGVGKSYTFTVMKNGSATALTLTISGTDVSGSNIADTVSFAAGDTISLRTTPSGTPTAPGVHQWTIKVSATGALMLGGNTTSPSTSATNYDNILGTKADSWVTTEVQHQIVVPTPGTLRNFYMRVTTAPSTGKSYAFTVVKNGTPTALSVTLSDAETSDTDLSNSISVADGDTLTLQSVPTGTPTSPGAVDWGIEFLPDTNNQYFLGFGNPSGPSTAATRYQYIHSTGDSGFSATSDDQFVWMRLPTTTLKKFYGKLGTASGAGKSRDLTVRKATADTALTINIADANTSGSVTTNVAAVQGEAVSLKTVPNSTPNATTNGVHTGLLLEDSVNSPLENLADNFNDNSLNTALWTEFEAGSATITEQNQRMEMSYPASSTSSTDGDISSVDLWDLTLSAAFLNVITVPSSSTSADAEMRLSVDSSNWFRWVYEAGTLYAQRRISGSNTTVFSVAYNASTHAWWKISESGGTVTWWTSTDGLNWTSQGTYGHSLNLTGVRVLIAGTCFQNETSPGSFVFDSFNVEPTPPPATNTGATLTMMGV